MKFEYIFIIYIFPMETNDNHNIQTSANDSNLNNLYETRITTGVLLLINCPELMEFGIDNQIWKIGPKFMGLKHIPLGPHYVNYALKDENYQIKQGFFIYIDEKTKNVIRKWDKETQDFTIFKQEEQDNFEIGINNLDFDAYLGLYPSDKIDIWKEVSYFISKKTLEKLEPVSRKYITSSKEYDNDKAASVKSNIFYTFLPTKRFIHKKIPEKLTEMFMDKSSIMIELIEKEFGNDYKLLFGELQYAFITFLLGEIYESFEQWKNILVLIFSCRQAISTHTKLYCDFIELIYFQIRNYPKDFFRDEILLNNFFSKLLEDFILYCYEEKSKIDNSVFQRVTRLRKFLKEVFNFELLSEEEKIINAYLQGVNLNDEDLPSLVIYQNISYN